jgi:hypothetical protein
MRLAVRVVPVALISMVLTASACEQEEQTSREEAMETDRQIAACLAEAGQDGSLENVDLRRLEDPDFNRIVEDCADQLGVEIPEPGETIDTIDELVNSAIRCLRQLGWDVPEPDRGSHGGLTFDGVDALVPDGQHEDFWADLEKCQATSQPTPS